jgi:hypothetical protein
MKKSGDARNTRSKYVDVLKTVVYKIILISVQTAGELKRH